MLVTLGLLSAFQPTIETTFDLAAKMVSIRRRFAVVSRQTVVPFTAIEGLGLG